ncbi:ATP-binding protein [Frankia sp. Cas4]|uniref:ATP-binding protein n=1 Tax=Frankia sp. Cas4 TaxID=3073927 RepID=UPI003A103371
MANLISDAIAPRMVPDIEIAPWRGTQLVAVEVYPSPSRPHHVSQEGPESGVYVRVGSTNRRADSDLVEELRRYARGEVYDEQATPELGSDAIDFPAAAEAFSQLRKLRPADLETLRLVTAHQGRLVPTVGGLLLFGRDQDRARLFPDAWIQAGQFLGTDKSQIVDQAEIRSNLVLAVEDALGFVRKHSLHGIDIGPVLRTDRWNLPPVAVREAVVNAVAHADYRQRGAPIRIAVFDDRLEVENPGVLQFGLTVDDIRRGVSKLRNRVIGRVFNSLGLIEQWGSGIQRMTTACLDAGLPPPDLEELGTRFRVTLWTQRVQLPTLDAKDRAILTAIPTDGALTSAIANAIGLSTRATRTRLIKLVDRGLVREVGAGPRDPKRRYFRSL